MKPREMSTYTLQLEMTDRALNSQNSMTDLSRSLDRIEEYPQHIIHRITITVSLAIFFGLLDELKLPR